MQSVMVRAAGIAGGAESQTQSLLQEMRRLVAEAETRCANGEHLAALSSLAAIPSVHRTLVEQISERLEETEDLEAAPVSIGLYL